MIVTCPLVPMLCNYVKRNILSNYYPWITVFLFEYLILGSNKTLDYYCIIIYYFKFSYVKHILMNITN